MINLERVTSPSRVPYSVNCSLCGCNGASVRCEKCNAMAFCIGCDDMYHRHPKRRHHLRQAMQAVEKYENLQHKNQQFESTSDKSDNSHLYPWRRVRTLPRMADIFNAHPSKMPIPPPRRKKKPLSFAGIKDTFKKFVHLDKSPKSNSNAQNLRNVKSPEPIYASIQPKKSDVFTSKSAFRPIPPPPPPPPPLPKRMIENSLYENTRKLSLPVLDAQSKMKAKLFASNYDLVSEENEYTNEVKMDPKNFSCQDIPAVPLAQCAPTTPVMHHGSTQSVFAGLCPTHPQMYCATGPHCHCQMQMWHNPCIQTCHHCHSNRNSLTNSFEELRHLRHSYDDSAELTDDEDDSGSGHQYRSGRASRNRMKKSTMHRSHSTYTMFGDAIHRYPMDCVSPMNDPYRRQPRKSSLASSPSPSVKSLTFKTGPPDRHKISDSYSDSSSSRSAQSKPYRPEPTYPPYEPKSSCDELNEQINETGQWSCRFCTFFNDPDKNICDICAKTRSKRIVKPTSPPKTIGKKEPIRDNAISLKPTEIPNLSSFTAYSDFVFDPKMIEEQLEIERELIRRRENEKRVEEQNRVLDELTVELKGTDLPFTDDDANRKVEPKPEVNNDDEKIMAKIIEEKISEQLSKLKIGSNDTGSATRSGIADTQVEAKHETPAEVKVQSVDIESKIADVTPIVPVASGYKQQPEVLNSGATFNQIPVQHPMTGNVAFSNPVNMISNPLNQYSYQPNQNLYMNQTNNGIDNPIYANGYGNGQMGRSNMISNQFHRQFPVQNGNRVPFENNWNNSMNRNSSFDDLQSISSRTSSSFFYPENPKMDSGIQVIHTLREAEKKGYTADDVEIAIQFSPNGPLDWLEDNWQNMYETVLTMSNNQIIELEQLSGKPSRSNFVLLTERDAKVALRLCKGNIWQAVEKCIQRYQDNKAFDSRKKPIVDNSTKSFSLKVIGAGSGKANNEPNVFSDTTEVSEEEIENVMNPEASITSQTPMQEFLSPKCEMQPVELLDYYVNKLATLDNRFDREELEALIENWRLEKAMIEEKRERMLFAEKEKARMQKMIDLHRRIGGYLSDGTTTEEELDREVELVFANHKEVRRKLAEIENETFEDSDSTFTGDVVSGLNSSLANNPIDDDEDKFDEIEQRIQQKLSNLIQTRNKNQEITEPETDEPENQTPVGQQKEEENISPEPKVSAKKKKIIVRKTVSKMDVNGVKTSTKPTSQKFSSSNEKISENPIKNPKQLSVSSESEDTDSTATLQVQSDESSSPGSKLNASVQSKVEKSSRKFNQNTKSEAKNAIQSSSSKLQVNQVFETDLDFVSESLTEVNQTKLETSKLNQTELQTVSDSPTTYELSKSEKVVNGLSSQPSNVTENHQPAKDDQDSFSQATLSPDLEQVLVSDGAGSSVSQESYRSTSIESTNVDAQKPQILVEIIESSVIPSTSFLQPAESKKAQISLDLKQNDQLEDDEDKLIPMEPVVVKQTSPQPIEVTIQKISVEPVIQNSLQTENQQQHLIRNPLVANPLPVSSMNQPYLSASILQSNRGDVLNQTESMNSVDSDFVNQKGAQVSKQLELKNSVQLPSVSTEKSSVATHQSAALQAAGSLPIQSELASEPLTSVAVSNDKPKVMRSDRNSIAIQEMVNWSQSMGSLIEERTNGSLEVVPQKPVFSRLKGGEQRRLAQLQKSEPDLCAMITDGTVQAVVPKVTRAESNLMRSNSESCLGDSTAIDQVFSQLRRKRARNLIVGKLRSVESLNSLPLASTASHNRLLYRNSVQNSVEISTEMPAAAAADSQPDTQITEKPLKILTKDALRQSSDEARMSRVEYSADFQWARTEFECELCATVVPVQDIAVMIACTHFACHDCLKNYFTVQIRERHRLVITCPFCDEPKVNADDDEQVFEYLGLFDQFVRHLVDNDVYELFQRKVRDRALMRDPNFLWCPQCSSGFIVPNPMASTVMCPDCRTLTCRKCKKPWKKQHFNISCEQYSEWEMLNDPQYAEQQLNRHLQEFGIECPNCKFRYQLAKGGCMHFRCIQCSYDFCGGCSRPFKIRCFRAKICERLGLHAHHPRNCLFYLRDKDIEDLKMLLDQHNVEYKTKLEGDKQIPRCTVMEQKETDSGMKDEPCNRYVEAAGLCKLHYKEYLATLIYQNKIDPIHIFNETELELTLRRENIHLPMRIKSKKEYVERLKSMILEKIPLE